VPATGIRRSDRVCLTLLLEVTGTDRDGKPFVEPAHTLLINRHGAVIVANHVFRADQVLHVRRTAKHESHRTGMARVIGQFGRRGEYFLYGIECVDDAVDLWGVEFPPFEKSEEAIARMLLECTYCHDREVLYLDPMQLESFETNHGLARHCKTCDTPSMWGPASNEDPNSAAHAAAVRGFGDRTVSGFAGANEQRAAVRLKTLLTACVRQPDTDDELAVCEELSSEGLSFRSKRRYVESSQIAIAVPYADATANIFIPARVVRVEAIPSAGLFRHGTEYIRAANRGAEDKS
jgi:PilZ domain